MDAKDFDYKKYLEWKKNLSFKDKAMIFYRNTSFSEIFLIIMPLQIILSTMLINWNFSTLLMYPIVFSVSLLLPYLRKRKYRIIEDHIFNKNIESNNIVYENNQ